MKSNQWLLVAAICASLAGCGGGSGSVGGASDAAPTDTAPPDTALAEAGPSSWPSAKYAGTWSVCLPHEEPVLGIWSERNALVLEPIAPNELRLQYIEDEYPKSPDCTGEPAARYHYRETGTLELVGEKKTVNGIELDKFLGSIEPTPHYPDGASGLKGTLGTKDGFLYVGDPGSKRDAEGFPTDYQLPLFHLEH